ncbi:MAG: glycosyltransferase [Verrucomicrobiota bacterium]
MRALIVTQGSTGDVYPLIALSQELIAQGHEAVLATADYFREDIEAAGVTFLQLPPDWSQEEFAESMRVLNRTSDLLKQLCLIYEQALPYLVENTRRVEKAAQEADVIISSYLFPYLEQIAERAAIPYMVTMFCHNVIPSQDYGPSNLPQLPWLPQPLRSLWYRFSWWVADRVISAALNRTVSEQLKACGLAPIRHFCTQNAALVLVTVSPVFKKEHARIDPKYVFTGYLRHQPRRDPELEARLKAFCAGEKVPVITFGSVVSDQSPAQMEQFLGAWPQDQKLIVQTGWAGFSVPEDAAHLLGLGKANHDSLFRHASVVVHHGGAGTTASVMHAGVPHIVIPHIADQPFWAGEVSRLGLGLTLEADTWPTALTNTIDQIIARPEYRTRAEAIAAQLSQESGRKLAVEFILSYVLDQKQGPAEPHTAGPIT